MPGQYLLNAPQFQNQPVDDARRDNSASSGMITSAKTELQILQ